MAAGGEKRSKTAHRTPTQMREYAKSYGGTPEQIRRRVARNAARRAAIREGLVEKHDKTKDVHHVVPLDKGGTNAKKNLRVVSAKRNRGWADGKI